jgi:hypothetical protein
MSSPLKPIAVLSLKRKAPDDETNWDACIFCKQQDGLVSSGSKAGVDRVIQACTQRMLYHEHEPDSVARRIQRDLNELHNKAPKWHSKTCYAVFCNKTNIECLRLRNTKKQLNTDSLQNDTNDASPNTSQHAATRCRIVPVKWDLCILCQKRRKDCSVLSQVLTYNAHQNITKFADNDEELRCKIAGLDLIAYEAKYHKPCYSTYLYQYNKSMLDHSGMNTVPTLDGCTDAETCSASSEALNLVICELQSGLQQGYIYEMSAIHRRYEKAIYNICTCHTVIGVRTLKRKLELHYGDEIDFVQPLDVTQSSLVMPRVSIDVAIQSLKTRADVAVDNVTQESFSLRQDDDTALFITRAFHLVAQKIATDLFKMPGHNTLDGINIKNAENVVPASLYLFLKMILLGNKNDLEDGNVEDTMHNRVLNLAQDVVYAVSNGKKLTPKHIGIALTVHQATRSKELVQFLNRSGHCISYDKVLRMDTSIAENEIERFIAHNNVFVPENLVHGRFIQIAADNIDILEETLDGKQTFHATQMVAFQRGPPPDVPIQTVLGIGQKRVLRNIPSELSTIGVSNYFKSSKCCPEFIEQDELLQYNEDIAKSPRLLDLTWLLSRFQGKGNGNQSVPGWSAFNEAMSISDTEQTSVGYLPIIPAPASDYDTVWTVMCRAMKIAHTLGLQYSNLVMDEALYFKAMQMSWFRKDECKSLILRLGSFHIGLNFLRATGQHMNGSGLEDVLIESGVYGDTTVTNILNGKSWNRGARCHKLTLEALWRIIFTKFLVWCENRKDDRPLQWNVEIDQLQQAFMMKDNSALHIAAEKSLVCATECIELVTVFEDELKENSTSRYWLEYKDMVFTLMDFIRAEREGIWDLHLASFSDMLPWLAIYDHTNYARWGPVYLQQMRQLKTKAPCVYDEFQAGNFVVKSSSRRFNQISTDQALEHVNKIGKISGGLVGITRVDTARERWCLTYNVRARLSEDTRKMFGLESESDSRMHVEAGPSRIKRDEEDVLKIEGILKEFQVLDRVGPELMCISTSDVANENVKEDLLNAHKRGTEAVSKFISERLRANPSVPLSDKLIKFKSKTLSSQMKKRNKLKSNQLQKAVRVDSSLLRRLVIASTSGRHVDLHSLLNYELSPVPLSLFDVEGNMRSCDKAVLSHILVGEHGTAVIYGPQEQNETCCILDGMAIVQTIGKPKNFRSFGDYADVFSELVLKHFSYDVMRVDLVFDNYKDESIKCMTRKHRAGNECKLIRRVIEGRNVPVPLNWETFINMSENKRDLTSFLSEELMSKARTCLTQRKRLVIAGGFKNIDHVATSNEVDCTRLIADHEEADTRMVLHAHDAALQGFKRTLVHSRDTDVLVLLVHFFPQLSSELWMISGTAKQRNCIPVHTVHNSLPPEVTVNLPAYHALTGCDSTSQFAGRGKRTTWKTYISVPALLIGLGAAELTETILTNVEQFVATLYSPGSSEKSVDTLRVAMFGKKPPEMIPPTSDALNLHIQRSHFQAMVWRNALVPKPTLPDPKSCGWQIGSNGGFIPIAMTKDAVPHSHSALVKCMCKGKDRCNRKSCSCSAIAERCTFTCSCSGYVCCNPYSDVQGHESDSD